MDWSRWFALLSIFSCAFCQIQDDPAIDQLEQDGANYLHNVMNKLQNERDESEEVVEITNMLNMDRVSESAPGFTAAPHVNVVVNGMIRGPTPSPPARDQVPDSPVSPPPATLTAEQLSAIYNAAIQKGSYLNQMQIGPFSANGTTELQNQLAVQPEAQGVAENYPGYYYYFYPIKSFNNGENQNNLGMGMGMGEMGDQKPAQDDNKVNQPAPPLFMAVSSFMGMAMMFIVSVLFLPKLGHIRSDSGPETKESPHELAVLGKLVFESLDGKDCTERMACEMGRVVRSFRIGKFVKIMEIVLPPNASRQMGMIRKAAVKKEKCNFIPCRFKSERPPAKLKNSGKPWKKNPSPHELWIRHFEKGKGKKKKPEMNVWTKNPNI